MSVRQPRTTVDETTRNRALAEAIQQSELVEAPRIWVASMESYEAGEPAGLWLYAARPVKRLEAAIRATASGSDGAGDSAEPTRWGVFAASGFGRQQFGPHSTLADIARQARTIRAEARAFRAWARLDEGNRDHCLAFPEAYQGHYDSLQEWVTLQVEAAGYDRLLDERVPGHLRPFVDINIDALAHDLVASGDVAAVEDDAYGGVWVYCRPLSQKADRQGFAAIAK